jgi:hypothetical protein
MTSNQPGDLEGYEKWFDHLRATGVNTGQPMRWRYRFDAWDRDALEALLPRLEAFGYRNPQFDGSIGSCFSLTVEIVETRTPQLMLARDREIAPLVKRDGEGQPWEHSMSVSWGNDGSANSALLTDAYSSPLRAQPGAAKRGR